MPKRKYIKEPEEIEGDMPEFRELEEYIPTWRDLLRQFGYQFEPVFKILSLVGLMALVYNAWDITNLLKDALCCLDIISKR